MIKEELNNDVNYINKCHSFGIDGDNYSIMNDIIVVNTPKENIVLLLDENYNTIGIYNKTDNVSKYISFEERLIGIKENYENNNSMLPYPFQQFSLKQINDLVRRMAISKTCGGYSFDMIINGKTLEMDRNNIYHSLLIYLYFLGEQMEKYYINLYQMRMMECEYPNINLYMSKLVNNMNECIDNNLKNKIRTFPEDIIKYLGQDVKPLKENGIVLSEIITFLIKQKGIEINGGFRHFVSESKNYKDMINLTPYAKELLRILDYPYEKEQENDINDKILLKK